tara:strand:+ start:885 stop:1022 length:138 start_codon:yes stop_codon:yes gene_type:complete
MVVNTQILSKRATNVKIFRGADAAHPGAAIQTTAQAGTVALPLAI